VPALQRFSELLVFVAAGTTLGLMSNHPPEPASIQPSPRRRPWTTPQLVVHESMMVLTQSFFGAPMPAMLLQGAGISCGVGGGGVNC
jgi:hypothetical protein